MVPQDISRCALSAGFLREQDDKRGAEHRDKESAAAGGGKANASDSKPSSSDTKPSSSGGKESASSPAKKSDTGGKSSAKKD